VALERASEYDVKHLDLLLELRDGLSPFTCHFEFEHHSWSHAEPVLKSARASVVQYDAPQLPGIIKPITLPARRSIVRLLGRNKRTWFEHLPKVRFEYQYSSAEL